jgi:hypothetical protein
MNEHQEGTNKKGFELAPLTEEQHAVTPVAKFTTELPFFYLTKQKKLLDQDIHYEGIDGNGNPIRWDVIPNRSPKIGVPAIEAHTIWTRLIKPSIEMHRTTEGGVPEILPLGGIRKCLRIAGWWEGGYEARRLLQALMQTGQATCDVDFLLPTDKLDNEGRPLFRAVKGIFNRFTIWQIGSRHVSEDEIASGNFKFDFDLDDTLYIQLHKLERDIQRNQDQRYIDNAYMWSVGATERRWYELMAAKIFGVVKNNGSYCEVLYSWYIKHHHTLTRLSTRARVVSQMNRIIRDHRDSGFIADVEYRATRDEQGQIDFVIRYYPGPAAKQSVKRVLSFLNTSTWPVLVERRRAIPKLKKNKQIPLPVAAPQPNISSDPSEDRATSSLPPQSAPEISEAEQQVDEVLVAALTKRGVTRSGQTGAISLLIGKSKESLLQVQDIIDYWDSIPADKKGPGLLIRFIQNNESVPASFETNRKRAVRLQEAKRREEQEHLNAEYEAYKKAEIDSYIAAHHDEFAALHDARIREHTEQFGNFNPKMIEMLARTKAWFEIGKKVTVLSFEEFVRAEQAERSMAALSASTHESEKTESDQTENIAA